MVRKAENVAARERARKLRLVPRCSLRASATGCWTWDPVSGAAVFAPEWRDILTIPRGKRQGTTLEYLFSRMRQADRELLRQHCAGIAEGRETALDIPVRMRRFDKTWAWILLRGEIETEGDLSGLLTGVGIEVSRLRLDKRFFPPTHDDSLTTYHTLLEHSPNNIIRFDRELFPLYANPAVSPLVPRPLEDLGGKRPAEVQADAEDFDFIQKNVDHVFASGEVVKARRVIHTGKGEIVGDVTFWPEFDAHGKVRSVISMQQDKTAEVKREQEALMNEMRFSALYRLTQMDDAPEEEVLRFVVEKIAELTGSPFGHLHVPPGMLIPGGNVVWSSSHKELFSEEELAGLPPRCIQRAFGLDPDRLPDMTVPKLSNKGIFGPDVTLFREKLPISRFMYTPALEGGRIMCAAAVYNKDGDYTEADMRQLRLFISGAWLVLRRRRHLVELTRAKESAELANKVKDRFLANVSHEVRTPLNGMLSMLQLLEMTPLSPDQTEYARSAATTGQTLLRIISDILDYSKMESGKLELDYNPFDIKESLRAAVGLFAMAAKQKGLKLRLSTVGDYPSLVHGDEARVRQILFNLVGNAVKFTEEGEIEVFCEARPMSDDLVTILLTVRDTGLGIPVAMQSKVFDAFTQVDGSSTRKHQGSGLGLGIVRMLAKAMGGSVSLKSAPGQGTMVECALPFTAVPEDLARPSAAPAPSETVLPSCPALTILVAEDDMVSRHAMRLFLQKLGHTPVCVTNGKEALEALRLYRFDCLISDVLMPEMDGLEVVRRIREGTVDAVIPSPEIRKLLASTLPEGAVAADLGPIPRDITIVAVSAHVMKGDREKFLAQGMDHYLSKPVNIMDLATMLLRVYEAGRAKSPR